MSQLSGVLKLLLLLPLGLLGGGLLLFLLALLGPLALLYFVTDRICEAVEAYAPAAKRRKRRKGSNLLSLLTDAKKIPFLPNQAGATRATDPAL